MMAALRSASLTALPAAVDATPLSFTSNPLPVGSRTGAVAQ
jgi:hypothetical protein